MTTLPKWWSAYQLTNPHLKGVVTACMDWTIGTHTLSGNFGFSKADFDYGVDLDGTPIAFLDATLSERFEKFSGELGVASSTGNTLDYIVSVHAQANKWSYLGVQAALLNASFDDYTKAPCSLSEQRENGSETICDFSGRETPFAPDFTGGV